MDFDPDGNTYRDIEEETRRNSSRSGIYTYPMYGRNLVDMSFNEHRSRD